MGADSALGISAGAPPNLEFRSEHRANPVKRRSFRRRQNLRARSYSPPLQFIPLTDGFATGSDNDGS